MSDKPQNPQAVERFFADRSSYITEECVLASDYDALLRMWEEFGGGQTPELFSLVRKLIKYNDVRGFIHPAVAKRLGVALDEASMRWHGIGPQDIAETMPQKGGE